MDKQNVKHINSNTDLEIVYEEDQTQTKEDTTDKENTCVSIYESFP